MADSTQLIKVIRQKGRGEARRSLERLVNEGKINMDDARKVWSDAFGGRLIAVPATTTIHISQELSGATS